MSFVVVHTARSEFRISRALRDVVGAITHPHLWLVLGWLEIKQRYRRSKIGPFWITLSFGIMVVALGAIYSRVLRGVTGTRYTIPDLRDAVSLLVDPANR
jgi:ABC-type polysaccharide/polyol phosphate export permease